MRGSMWRTGVGVLIFGTVILLMSGGAAPADDKVVDELKVRLDKLEKQNEELRQRVGEKAISATASPDSGPYKPEVLQQKTLNQMIDTYIQEKEARKRAADEAAKAAKEAEGYRVGSDLGMSVRWNPLQGLLFETPNRDFISHIGVQVEWDTVSFTQSPNLRLPTQLGELQDGTFFRRIRPLWDGTAYDTVEWFVKLGLEQVQGELNGGQGTVTSTGTTPTGTTVASLSGKTITSTGTLPGNQTVNSNINLDEIYGGVYGIPFIGRIRAGHMKVPQGLEGNQWSSSVAQTFMENAAYTDAFYNVFATGVAAMNSFLNDGVNGDRMTYQAMLYRDDSPRTAGVGNDFGDGDYAATGRISALLLDDCEDQHFLHVGLSATGRKCQRLNNDTTGDPMANFQARPELRDSIGGFDGDGSTAPGAFPGNNNRMVGTGNIPCSGQTVIGSEIWYNLGPFSAMAEYAIAQMNGANVPVTVGTTTRNVYGDRTFRGGYVTLSYFLTGESRAYDHAFGRENGFYILRPNSNFWFKRSEDGGLTAGPGAWEVAARYSYLNLNDGPVQGGVLGCVTLGLNWYLNNNLKIQFNYIHDARYDKGGAGGATVGTGNLSGTVDGFGTRMQIQF